MFCSARFFEMAEQNCFLSCTEAASKSWPGRNVDWNVIVSAEKPPPRKPITSGAAQYETAAVHCTDTHTHQMLTVAYQYINFLKTDYFSLADNLLALVGWVASTNM